MGKKNKKSSFKKQLKNNRVLLAALGGAAAGITLANLLGTEKAQRILQTVEDSMTNFSERVSKELTGDRNNLPKRERSKEKEPSTASSVS